MVAELYTQSAEKNCHPEQDVTFPASGSKYLHVACKFFGGVTCLTSPLLLPELITVLVAPHSLYGYSSYV